MEPIRYVMAAILVITLPLVITFWLVIHGGSRRWKASRPLLAYSVALAAMIAIGAPTVIFLDAFIGGDLGFQPVLIGLGGVLYLSTWVFSRSIRKHLDFRTFAGVPEIQGEATNLIDTGPFALVRHPRYLMIAVSILGWCLIANFAGAYLVGAASILGLMAVIQLEERELVARFGDAYRDYQRRVPQFLPSPGGLGRYLKG